MGHSLCEKMIATYTFTIRICDKLLLKITKRNGRYTCPPKFLPYKIKTLNIKIVDGGLGYERVWRLNGQIHRLDGPAFIDYDGDSYWYEDGLFTKIEWGK